MSNDFSTYNFKGKNIRIKRDKDTNTNWFVIVDVLSVVISNKVDAFWEKIKIQALSDEDIFSPVQLISYFNSINHRFTIFCWRGGG